MLAPKTARSPVPGLALAVGFGLGIAIEATLAIAAVALPPPDETPEEVLRNELSFEARSPVDGQPLTAAEYARLQEELAEPEYEQQVDPEIQHTIFLLRLLRAVRILTPF